MGFLDRLLGREDPASNDPRNDDRRYDRTQYDRNQYDRNQYDRADQRGARPQADPRSDDEIALERYRYLLRTAPPETIEQVHAEAFAKLTPEQRRQVYEELKRGPEQPTGDDADSLARAATRSEIRQPGTMERAFGGAGGAGALRGGPSFGSMLGGSLLGTVAGYVIGSAIVSSFLPDPGYTDAGAENADAAADGGDSGADGSGGGDSGGDSGGWGGDSGGDGGGWGGDFGGGDFGGGDFGGGFDV